jgi:omega-6 fatty acid desaturase (delta-12 desaturase)
MYRGISEEQRRQLKFIRSPISIMAGLVTTFAIGMCILPWRRKPQMHRMAPVIGVAWWSATIALAWFAGIKMAVLVILLPGFVWSSVGSYLFYAQHNFPAAELRGRRGWEYTHAAIRCSSYFEMPAFMHWLTGNIGYHHVHHLNHSIPFYRLPEAMEALPELRNPGRTSWALRDIQACLKCSVWDPERGRFISFEEADYDVAQAQAAAAK